ARAQAVLDFLVAAGAPRERLVARGYGAARPVASNGTEEGRFRNRRIEFGRAG
ncbi:MAG: OmpA family protein, partial [Burkholderiaceae bacterium]|nr:OmpA family protein [Burkholderiaceae bacterium]